MRRYMMEAIKTLLPQNERHAIMQRTRYRMIEIDPITDMDPKAD